jgi:hypothetical protein
VTEEDRSKLRAHLASLSVPALRNYRAMLVKFGKAAGTQLVTNTTEETLRLVDYMIEEQADLHF